MARAKYEIVVVGAGNAGLSAALQYGRIPHKESI